MNELIIDQELEQCIKRWTPTIRSLAKKYANTIAGTDDLISEGKMCIIKSFNSFDSNRGSLNGYISKCLKNAIQSAAAANSFALTVPSGSLNTIENPKRFKARHYPIEEVIDNRSNYTDIVIDIQELIQKFDTDGIAWAHLIDNMCLVEIAEDKCLSLGKVSYVVKRVKKLIRSNLQ